MTMLEIFTEAAQLGVILKPTPTGDIAWFTADGRLPESFQEKLIAYKKKIIATMQGKPCQDLGDAIPNERMISLGVNPLTCGCGGKIRNCEQHGGFCTSYNQKDGFRCCMTCEDFDPA